MSSAAAAFGDFEGENEQGGRCLLTYIIPVGVRKFTLNRIIVTSLCRTPYLCIFGIFFVSLKCQLISIAVFYGFVVRGAANTR